MRSGFRDEEQSERWRAKTAVETAAYAERLDPDEQPLGIERQVSMRTADLVVTGRVDRLDDRDGELVVVDYKTSRAEPTPDDARTSLPLGLYAAAVAGMFRRPCTRVELHHVPSGTVAAHEHTPDSLARKVSEAESIAQDLVIVRRGVRARDGPATTSFPRAPARSCSWCDFRQHCPEGQAVGTEKSGWAALEP